MIPCAAQRCHKLAGFLAGLVERDHVAQRTTHVATLCITLCHSNASASCILSHHSREAAPWTDTAVTRATTSGPGDAAVIPGLVVRPVPWREQARMVAQHDHALY